MPDYRVYPSRVATPQSYGLSSAIDPWATVPDDDQITGSVTEDAAKAGLSDIGVDTQYFYTGVHTSDISDDAFLYLHFDFSNLLAASVVVPKIVIELKGFLDSNAGSSSDFTLRTPTTTTGYGGDNETQGKLIKTLTMSPGSPAYNSGFTTQTSASVTALNGIAAETGVQPSVQMGLESYTAASSSYVYFSANDFRRINTLQQSNNAVSSIDFGAATSPYALSCNADIDRLAVTLTGVDKVAIVNTSTNAIIGTPALVGSAPGPAEISNAGKAYIPNFYSNTVSVMSTSTGAVSSTINVGTAPYHLALTPDQTKLLVPNINAATMSVIGTTAGTVSATITVVTPYVSSAMSKPAINKAGTRAYVCYTDYDEVNSYANPTTCIKTINLSTNAVIATSSTWASSNELDPILSKDETKVYAATYTNSSQSIKIMKVSDSSITTLSLSGSFTTLGDLVLDPDGTHLYATQGSDQPSFTTGGKVSAINTKTDTVVSSFNTAVGLEAGKISIPKSKYSSQDTARKMYIALGKYSSNDNRILPVNLESTATTRGIIGSDLSNIRVSLKGWAATYIDATMTAHTGGSLSLEGIAKTAANGSGTVRRIRKVAGIAETAANGSGTVLRRRKVVPGGPVTASAAYGVLSLRLAGVQAGVGLRAGSND